MLLPSMKKALRISSFWSTLSTRFLRLLDFLPAYRIHRAKWVAFQPSQGLMVGAFYTSIHKAPFEISSGTKIYLFNEPSGVTLAMLEKRKETSDFLKH
jgi:hypothetical protein